MPREIMGQEPNRRNPRTSNTDSAARAHRRSCDEVARTSIQPRNSQPLRHQEKWENLHPQKSHRPQRSDQRSRRQAHQHGVDRRLRPFGTLPSFTDNSPHRNAWSCDQQRPGNRPGDRTGGQIGARPLQQCESCPLIPDPCQFRGGNTCREVRHMGQSETGVDQ